MRERKTHQLRYEREGTQLSDAARMGGANKKLTSYEGTVKGMAGHAVE